MLVCVEKVCKPYVISSFWVHKVFLRDKFWSNKFRETIGLVGRMCLSSGVPFFICDKVWGGGWGNVGVKMRVFGF